MSGFVVQPVPVQVPGLTHLHTGKVRELYADANGDLVMVASNRISAFDWVLEPEIPEKGDILTALSLWWFEQFTDLYPNHVISTELPAGAPAEWAGRTLVCRRLEMVPVECVARGYLAGSGWAEYQVSRTACGVPLPEGLQDGSELPEPIFTPAMKAAVGDHDENVTYERIVEELGEPLAAKLREATLTVYSRARDTARERGIILADTKFEFGLDADGDLVLADEVLTPDSSRFWPADGWLAHQAGAGGAVPSFDKQYVRDWLASPESGWDPKGELPPPAMPEAVVAETRRKYVEAYERLTGLTWR